MKTLKLYCLIFLLVVPVHAIRAQKPIVINSETFFLGEKQYDGIVVTIPEVGFEQVKNSWIKILEKGTKSKVVEAANGEISIFGAFLKSISKKPMNVYSQIISQDSSTWLKTTVELKRDFYITETNSESEYNQLKSILHELAKTEYVDVVSNELSVEEKKQQDLESELRNLQSEKERLGKSIQDDEQNILVSNEALLILDSDLKLKNEELASHKTALNSAENDIVRASIEEKIEQIEKEKNKIVNSIEKENKNIVGYNSDIDDARIDIQTNIGQQNIKTGEVESQRSVVNKLTAKLATIEKY